MSIVAYGQREMDYLKSCDSAMSQLVCRYGKIERTGYDDVFLAAIHSIISQQISTKAADTVWNKLESICHGVTAERVLCLSQEQMQSCGIGVRKAGFLKSTASAFQDGTLSQAALERMSDEEAVKSLSACRGIGVWTAEMLLLFALGRQDVLSFGDLGIRRGLCIMHGIAALDKKQFACYRARYSPYGSVASLYIWKLSQEL